MSIDVLQTKIRKMKNPAMVNLTMNPADLPPHLLEAGPAAGYGTFCRELLNALKGIVPAVRLSFTPFALLGADGLKTLSEVLNTASQMGFYVALEAPQILSTGMAAMVADQIFGEASLWPCDGLIVDGYLGSDIVKPFLSHCKDGKDLYCVVRTSNKSAPEIQDLLTGTRLVHAAAADLYNRFTDKSMGKSGYSRLAIMAGAGSAESLKTLRTKYPRLFILVDDLDYPGCNAKICANAFDKFGHGAVCSSGYAITQAWKNAESDGRDYVEQAVAAAERMKNNLTRYTIIL
ncbi:MAG: hypothetical protein IJZ39_02245 [Oscillospiraceae bacterium]|nr:hypothetical protein [Oscillospiraceae bacterium]